MRRFPSGAIMVALAALTVSPAMAAESAGDAAELARLESVWNDAHLHGDVAALERLWTDDVLIIVPEMPPISKAGALAMWRGAGPKFAVYETSNIRARVHGDAAIVTGDLHRARDFGGRTADERWQFTKVYVRAEGKWFVASFHASAAPK